MKLLIHTDKGTVVIETDSLDILQDESTYHISESSFGLQVILNNLRGSPFMVPIPHSSNAVTLSQIDPALLYRRSTKEEE